MNKGVCSSVSGLHDGSFRNKVMSSVRALIVDAILETYTLFFQSIKMLLSQQNSSYWEICAFLGICFIFLMWFPYLYEIPLDWPSNILDLMWNVLFKASCRQWQSGVSTESLDLDDHFNASPASALLLREMDPSLCFGPFTLRLALLPPQVHSYSRKELWSLTMPTFLSMITLGASSIRPRFPELFSKFDADPRRLSLFVPP